LVATKIRPIPAGDSSSFIIHDNSSEIAKFIPEKYVEPLVIISRIQGFDGIDDYVIHLINDKLKMFADTSNRNDLCNSFQEYMHDLVMDRDVSKTWSSPNSAKTKVEEEEETTAADDATTA
jgi:hypothetical protein